MSAARVCPRASVARGPHAIACTSAQADARSGVCQRIEKFGRPSIRPSAALSELLRSIDTYCLCRKAARRPYEADRVKAPGEGVTANSTLDLPLLSGKNRRMAEFFWNTF